MRAYQNRINSAIIKALGRIVASKGGDPDNYLIISWGRCTAVGSSGFQFRDLIVKTNGEQVLPLGNLELSISIRDLEGPS